MTSTPTSNDLTRQQLEELDALLQRMLSAPPANPEPSRPAPIETPVVESWRIDRPAPLPPRLHLVVPDLPASPAAKLPPTPAFVPAEPPIPPTAPVPSLPDLVLESPEVPVTPSMPFLPVPAAGTPSDPFIAESTAEVEIPVLDRFDPIPLCPSDPEPTTTVEPLEEVSLASGIPPAMWPVFAVNWIAEECLKSFGGESLTKPAAKWAMGVAGILMMIGAAAWTLNGFGIVSFPSR